VAVISVSDTRTIETDAGGVLVQAMTGAAGFSVVGHDLIPDEPDQLRARVRELVSAGLEATSGSPEARAVQSGIPSVDVILVTGGTGVAPRDGTVDAVAPLFERRLDGFGELFRMLSFAEIGPAAMLSRACAGIVAGVAVFLIPGSPSAIRLALQRLILPELGHLISELRRQPAAPISPAPRHEGHHHGSEHRHRG
jgi:molybdopterin adenylyltransferase